MLKFGAFQPLKARDYLLQLYLSLRYKNFAIFILGKRITQEYPTEPLRKISVLQSILELAGNFLTGIEILLGIYC